MNTNESVGKDRWVRIPAKGIEPNTGLHRSYIYELISAGSIRTASIRKPGALKGVRLVWLPSLLAFVERHVETEGGAR
jgi:hypothetical protein